ncbi:MAG: right-handed parallel beta-helix repeat-containing protein, partial [Planctomycetota bacterium]
MSPSKGRSLVLAALLVLTSCDRFTPPLPPSVSESPVPGGGGLGSSGLADISHPRFGGVGDLVAGDTVVRIGWQSATDDTTPPEEIDYLIYQATAGSSFDLSTPSMIVTGENEVILSGLENGVPLRFIVRARDSDQEIDPNENEWPVTPNPVRYVRSGAPSQGADGLSPESAFATLAQAIASSIDLWGVNFHVAQGLYPENIFLFEGMMLFGGFPSEFGITQRDPDLYLTQFGIAFPTDLVQLLPGDLLNGIDGISLAGNFIAESCVFAEDCNARITRCQLSRAITQGIDLRSDYAEGEKIQVLIADCVIAECNGEGIRIQGIAEIRIDDCEIRNNFNEGIESQWLRADTEHEAHIEITRCRIHNNGDEGIDLDIGPVDELNPLLQQEAVVRVRIRHCTVEENRLEGIVIDLDNRDVDQMDVRVRIDDTLVRANGMTGIFLDADSNAAFRIARCQISANLGDGISATGLATGPIPSIQHCNIIGNALAGVATFGLGSLKAWHCWVDGNTGGIYRSPRGSVTFHNCVLSPGHPELTLSCFQYCLIDGDLVSTDLPEGVFAADPEMVGRPILYTRASGLLDGSVLLDEIASVAIGTQVEIADDGILRQITSMDGPLLTLDPALAEVPAGSSVFFWAPGEGPMEDPTPLTTSAMIQAADPTSVDSDGFPHDLGPLGNNSLHFIGPDPSLPMAPDEIQMTSVNPAPSMPSIDGFWHLSFTRELPTAMPQEVRLTIDGTDHTGDLELRRYAKELWVKIFPTPQPGQQTLLEILPFTGDDSGNHLVARIFIEQRSALVFNEDETTGANDLPSSTPELDADPLIISGAIATDTD